MEKVEKFRFWCQKVLPLVYDDSLSYYETLCKMTQIINEVIEDVNNIPSIIRELVSDEKLKDILSELLNELRAEIVDENDGTQTTSSKNRTIGDLVWWNNQIYEVVRTINIGDAYINYSSNPNIKHVSIENLLNTLREDVNTNTTDILLIKTELNNIADVRKYGAKGDGVHDDTQAFQNAIDSGLNVYVPTLNGETYLIKSTLTVNTLSQAIFSDVSTNWATNSALSKGKIICDTDTLFSVLSDANTFSNLTCISNYARNHTCFYINATNINDNADSKINNCVIYGFDKAVVYYGRELTFRDNLLNECNIGIELHYTYNGSGGSVAQQPFTGFRGVIINGNQGHGIITSFIKHVEGILNSPFICNNTLDIGNELLYSTATIVGAIISNNICTYGNRTFIYSIGDTADCIISNNIIRGGDNYKRPTFGILLEGNNTNLAISNNVFDGCNSDCINISKSGKTNEYITITGNKFIDWGHDNVSGRATLKCGEINSLVYTSNTLKNEISTANFGIRGTGERPLWSNLKVIANSYTVTSLLSNYTAGDNAEIQTLNV